MSSSTPIHGTLTPEISTRHALLLVRALITLLYQRTGRVQRNGIAFVVFPCGERCSCNALMIEAMTLLPTRQTQCSLEILFDIIDNVLTCPCVLNPTVTVVEEYFE